MINNSQSDHFAVFNFNSGVQTHSTLNLLYTVDSRYLEVEGTFETLRDIHTSTYQNYRSEENTI